ncbi:MAG: hypothetical protein U9R37_08500 [Campylobacterota bacterium]|nr:hypothetical protein [Campylobacterota bacterium]
MKNILLIITIFFTSLIAKEEKSVDYLNLGAILIKDGYHKRAKATLDKVDVTKENFDFIKFYTLKGVMNQSLGYPNLSNIYLKEAIENGQKSKSVYLYMAKNYWVLKDYKNTIFSIKSAEDLAKKQETFFVILAESYKQSDDFDNAWKALDEGIELFPKYSKFYRQKFYYLMELGFYKRAMFYAKEFLKHQNYSTKDYLSVSLVMRENKMYTEAATLLEEAVIREQFTNPTGDDIKKLYELLGQIYIDNEHYTSAALVFDQASVFYPQFAHKAATLYLKSKLPVRSFQLNRRVLEQKEKFSQRVGIDIYLEDYEALVATLPALKRYGILKDDNIKYALGYGYFRVGEFDKSKKYLKQIQSSNLFKKATYIFEKIDRCENNPLDCNN